MYWYLFVLNMHLYDKKYITIGKYDLSTQKQVLHDVDTRYDFLGKMSLHVWPDLHCDIHIFKWPVYDLTLVFVMAFVSGRDVLR